ncbi:general odorant-binding protein 28a-like [Aphomia sociella]
MDNSCRWYNVYRCDRNYAARGDRMGGGVLIAIKKITVISSTTMDVPNYAGEAAITPAQKALIQSKLLSSGLECIKDHPLSISDISTFRKKVIPNNKNAQCFTACLFKRIGIMDDMGKLNPSGAHNSAMKIFKNSEDHLTKVDGIIEECSFVNEQNTPDDMGCERAKMAFECLVKHAPKFDLDIDF